MKSTAKLPSCSWECEDSEIEIKRRGNPKTAFNSPISTTNGLVLIPFNVNFIQRKTLSWNCIAIRWEPSTLGRLYTSICQSTCNFHFNCLSFLVLRSGIWRTTFYFIAVSNVKLNINDKPRCCFQYRRGNCGGEEVGVNRQKTDNGVSLAKSQKYFVFLFLFFSICRTKNMKLKKKTLLVFMCWISVS